MNPEQQRIAIAEACGWKQDSRNVGRYGVREDGWWNPISGKFHSGNECLPDYLNDLNAMHEAEKILFPTFEIEWHRQLQSVCGYSWRVMIHATAAQRAKAFLKTLNLWKP